MTRIAAITPAHREHLRRLRAEFDEAYAAIEDVSDRCSESFRTAAALYRTWIKAIDAHALALLDDLDAFDIGGGGSRPEPADRRRFSPVPSVSVDEVDHVFSEMDDILHAREFIDDRDDAADLLVGGR